MLAALLLSTIFPATTLAFDGPASTVCGLSPDHPPFFGASYDCSESQDTGYDQGNAFDITVVTIDGEPVEKDTANAFWVMREAAAADGVQIHIVSGFRTMSEQEYFYMCYECCCCNNCNLAAPPGYSNHQSGHALDLNASDPGVYNWLATRGGEFGFTETVPSENWHWEWWGGGPGGGICDITVPPTGTLDAAACDGISGWAQDPDLPEAVVEVQIAFGAPLGDPAAVVVSRVADVPRDDLCEPLGTCNHGFAIDVPLSLQDGAAHDVHVYGVDGEGADNVELAASPAQLLCPRPAIPPGVRRLATADAIARWGFSTFWRMMVIEPAQLEAIEESTALGAVPLLVRTQDAPEVWWVDAGWRRHVPSPEVAAAWGLDLGTTEVVTDAILEQWREGTPMRAVPTLVSTDGITVYLVDDAQGDEAGGDDGQGDDGDADGSGDDGDGSDDGGDGTSADDGSLPGALGEDAPGCGCTGGAPTSAAAFASLLLLGRRRRRR